MASLFSVIENAQAVLSQGGYEQQTQVFSRNDLVYAKVGNKYVRIMGQGETPVPKMLCVHLDLTDCNLNIGCDRRGNLAINGSIDQDQTRRIFKQATHLSIATPPGVKLLGDK
jgi:hypothetical protein